jgi:hypothetical protein
VGLFIEVLHLLIVAAGVTLGGWALIALRHNHPSGRFAGFGVASATALVGCAALAGELGIVSPLAWFAILASILAAVTAAVLRTGHRKIGAV